MPCFSKILALVVVSLSLCSCQTGAGGGGFSPQERERAAQIAAEPTGNYWVGRRYVIPYCRMWGYVRKPGEPWSKSKLVMMNESQKRQPDRLPEAPASGPAYSYDHNYEYRLTGYFDGNTAYDPNSNLFLPTFTLQGYNLINKNPGYLFKPGESFRSNALPRPEPQP